jgi:hypothetical protein
MSKLHLASSSAMGVVYLVLLAVTGYAQSSRETTRAQLDPAIRPFKFHASDAALADLRRPLADEKYAYDQLDFFYKKGLAYAQEMGNRPQTLYGIEDSPIGLAAWMLDHDARSYELIARIFAGKSEGLTRDDILDNVTLYWLTNTALSSARLYWESKLPFFAPKGVAIPVAVSAFPDEIYTAPRSWTERADPKLLHYNRLPNGGMSIQYFFNLRDLDSVSPDLNSKVLSPLVDQASVGKHEP